MTVIAAGRTLSHYRLVERIGEGGMGVVWRALDTSLRREVALKILPDTLAGDPEWFARLEREARLLAGLSHPNLVTVHSVEADRGVRFFTMELLRGSTLDRLVGAGQLPLPRFYEIALQLVDAVAAAHEHGVTHGDLKPSNVMVTSDERVKVLDFGLARSCEPSPLGEADETRTLVSDPPLAGTPRYMAPEQLEGHPADERSDLFSLGVMLYEMLAGTRPFAGETGAGLIASILETTPQPPSSINREVPRHLDRVIGSCLSRRPASRPVSARALHAELLSLRRGRPRASDGPDRSIAVLPFADMSEARDQDYFCEGVADEIINAISRVESLRVASRTSSFRFKDSGLDSREIGDRLGVGHLLEGSVRKSGRRLRVSARLVGAEDGCQRWSERYDRDPEDVFAIQEEIADSVVRALEVTLNPHERRAIRRVATDSAAAYDRYLRGRQHFRQFRRKSIERATTMFVRAIELDENYADAWAGLADCHSYLYMFWVVSEEHLREAERASARAVELDPESPEAWVARGVAVSIGRRFEEADRHFDEATRLNPRMFEAHYFQGRGHYARGELEQAVTCFRKACEARPEDYQAPSLLASALNGLGRRAEARAAYRATWELSQKQLEVYPGETRAIYFGAIALCQLGERRELALELARRALAMDPEEPQVLYNVACVHALLGSTADAIDCLRRTIEHGGWWKTWAKHDPDLVSIRDDPRFVALVEG